MKAPSKIISSPYLAGLAAVRHGIRCRPEWAELLCRDQCGATAVEYMLVIATIVVVMASALTVLHDSLAQYFTKLTSWVASPYP